MAFDAVVKEIYRLSQEEGLNDTEIANLIGCSRATVNRERKKNKIPKSNLANRLDKKYVCIGCKKEITIRRKERRQTYCPECKDKIANNIPLPFAANNIN